MRWLSTGCLLIVILITGACEQQPSRKATSTSEPSEAREHAEMFRLTETLGGRKSWELEAESATSFHEQERILMKGIKVDFYDTCEVLVSTLTADSGAVDTKRSDMRVWGSVRLVGNDESVLETDELQWDAKTEKVFTDGDVRITKADQMITGRGLVTDPRLERVVIKEQFQATAPDLE